MPIVNQAFGTPGQVTGDVAKGSYVGARRAIQTRLDSGTTTATAYFTVPFTLPAYARIVGYQIKNASALTHANGGTATNVSNALFVGNSLTHVTNSTASAFFTSGTTSTLNGFSMGPPALTTLTTNWNTTSSEVTLYVIPWKSDATATGTIQFQINTTAATNGMYLSGSNTRIDLEIVYDEFAVIPRT